MSHQRFFLDEYETVVSAMDEAPSLNVELPSIEGRLLYLLRPKRLVLGGFVVVATVEGGGRSEDGPAGALGRSVGAALCDHAVVEGSGAAE